ncbi:hypothetical protein ACGFX4_41275 [Kitasatospora sp. NPDC048365]|uniref:hypothetical protein n=1 Tax=Kitasatospora sp. NPDC048365 TaxID=3364050 RepID=UPI003710C6FB
MALITELPANLAATALVATTGSLLRRPDLHLPTAAWVDSLPNCLGHSPVNGAGRTAPTP